MPGQLTFTSNIVIAVRHSETPSQLRSMRRYFAEFSAAMVAYVIILFAAVAWLRVNPDASLRVVVALAPLVPVVLVFLAIMRLVRRSDELIRRVQVESMAMAFAGTALLVITYGFLEVAGFPRLSVWWVWVAMGLLWFAGSMIARRRYG